MEEADTTLPPQSIIHTHPPNAQWWAEHWDWYPILAEIFLTFGATTVSSAECERVFSGTGQLVSDRRAALTGEHIAQHAFLHENRHWVW